MRRQCLILKEQIEALLDAIEGPKSELGKMSIISQLRGAFKNIKKRRRYD